MQMRYRRTIAGEALGQRDLDTVDVIEDLLSQEEVDLRELRKISAVRGLVTTAVRARVWPQLLQVDLTQQLSFREYIALSKEQNDFRSIISADVHRSLFHFYDASEETQRTQQRVKLERLLNAVVNYHQGNNSEVPLHLEALLRGKCAAGAVHYYQGLHDIASIFLLTLGELLAFTVMCQLTKIRLRDCTQSTLEPVAELLKLQVPILQRRDPALARHLEKMNIPCYFAISWFITWFSHDVPHFPEVCRLFDFFLATHPLMPLYVGAAGMHAARTELLQANEMSELHKSLVNLRVLHYHSTDDIILSAISLYHQHPPRRVVRESPFRLEHCVTPFAVLDNGQWVVPDRPPAVQCRRPHKWLLHTVVGGVMTNNGISGTSIKLVSMAGLGIFAVAVVALRLIDSEMEHIQKTIWDSVFNGNH